MAAALGLLGTVPARAQLTCALPEVLRALDAELQRHGSYGVLDARSVGERTGPGAASASCSIRLVVRGYDTNTYGALPLEHVEIRGYEVIRLRNGLMVQLVP